MRFSLIVCTFGRTQSVADLLGSLVAQDRGDFEVILVDQNRDLRLDPIVAQFSDRLSINHIHQDGRGGSLARNTGLDQATGEIVGFPDDDCTYLAGYLDIVDQIFLDDRSITAITGHPTATVDYQLGDEWFLQRMDLDRAKVLNRCQEFTIFIRRSSLGELRYNESLGVGAPTPWGADEGPDLLIRLIETGARTVYFPKLFVYHPDKLRVFDQATLDRAASYSRGRGCLFRLHDLPRSMIMMSLIRALAGGIVYALRWQGPRSLYYFTILRGLLRGLTISKQELEKVRNTRPARMSQIQAIPLSGLPAVPLVSVLITNYNYAKFLTDSLGSVLSQTYSNLEVIVCDDGSTDHSVEVIEAYGERDSRIRLIRQENSGQNAAYNACYAKSRGEIICFLDADDVFAPSKIEEVVASFQDNPEAALCNHACEVIDEAGSPRRIVMQEFLDSGWLAHKALGRGACVYVPTTSCMSIRREIGDILFPITVRQKRDLDGYLAMAGQFLAPICLISRRLSGYRIHGHNMGGITQPTAERLQYELELIRQRTANVRTFLAERFGEHVSSQILIQENPQYIQAALKLLAISKQGRKRSQALALIRSHPSAKWRTAWSFIFSVPGPLSRHVVPWMHASYRMKSAVRRLLSKGKVATS